MLLENKKTLLNTFVVLFFLVLLIVLADLDNLRETMFRPDLIKEQFPKIITQAAKNTLNLTNLILLSIVVLIQMLI